MPTAEQFWGELPSFTPGRGGASAFVPGPAGWHGDPFVQAGGGSGVVEGGQAADGGAASSYPSIPWADPLTAAQVLDISLACQAAMQSGEPAPLKEPFTYNGIGTPGLKRGDRITHIVYAKGQCMTNAEAARQGIQGRPGWPWYYYAVGALGVGVLAYALTR